jgi:hypothetical protein
MLSCLSSMCSFGQPVRIQYIPRLAFSIAQRRTLARPNKPPGKNWAQAFEKRHPELKAERVRSIDWKRHEIYIYDKVMEWFEVISNVLQDPSILCERMIMVATVKYSWSPNVVPLSVCHSYPRKAIASLRQQRQEPKRSADHLDACTATSPRRRMEVSE